MSFVPNRRDKDGNRMKPTKADIEFGRRGRRPKPGNHPRISKTSNPTRGSRNFLDRVNRRGQEIAVPSPSSRKEMMEKKRRDLARRRAEAAKRRAEAARRRAEAAKRRAAAEKRRKEIERRKKNLELARKDRGRNVRTKSGLRKPATSPGPGRPPRRKPMSGKEVSERNKGKGQIRGISDMQKRRLAKARPGF